MRSTYFLLLVCALALPAIQASATSLDGIYTGVLFDDQISRGHATVDTLSIGSVKKNGVGGSAVVGFSYELDDWILSLEGDATLNSAKEVWSKESWWAPLMDDLGYVPTDYTASTKFQRSFGFLARYGYTFGDSVFLYGSVGWIETWLRTTFTDVSDPSAPLAVKFKDHMTGFRYGAGVEVPVANSLSIRGEYLHTNYKNYAFEVSDGVSVYDLLVNPSADTFRLGLVFHW